MENELGSLENELEIVRQITSAKQTLAEKMKKENAKQTNFLKNLLLTNESESNKIKTIENKNANVLQKILENLTLNENRNQEKQDQRTAIKQLKEELSKAKDSKELLEKKLQNIKVDQQNKAISAANLSKLLVKYSRIKFAQVKDAYILAYYLTNDEKTIPICIEKQEQQSKTPKTQQEIMEELHARIAEIDKEYV